ncbi:MAG: phosphoglucosamine mutase [Terriglobia bacterium]
MRRRPQLFGTDGIRGVAGNYPLDRRTVASLGQALAEVLASHPGAKQPQVLLGEDTRESSAWIARVLAAGLQGRGAAVISAGVLTTPGVAFLTRHYGFSAGVMVSASHNPFEDNGIKILSTAGTKLAEAMELEIEHAMAETSCSSAEPPEAELPTEPALKQAYLDFLANLIPANSRISRFQLVVDCAHGAASGLIPEFLSLLGIPARILHAEPDGRNINLRAGSVHPEKMAALTQSAEADLGVAFDGDADRSIFASRRGRICDGDHVIFAVAPFLKAQHRLKGDAVVGTLMTNLGLELALRDKGIGMKRTPVGDKFVLDEMLRSGINLGGEPSGHIIFSDVSLAGDGAVTLLQMLRLLVETGETMDELVREYRPFPQLIRNVRVTQKAPLESVPEVVDSLAQCRQELAGRGRVVVRYSGTEPVARVMVEGEAAERVEFHANLIAAAIQHSLGAND